MFRLLVISGRTFTDKTTQVVSVFICPTATVCSASERKSPLWENVVRLMELLRMTFSIPKTILKNKLHVLL